MKIRQKIFIISAAISLIFSNLSYSQNSKKQTLQSNQPQQTKTISQTEKLKDILYKVVKQDEYIDDITEKIESRNYKLTEKETQEIISTINLVKNNLENISNLNKNELQNVSPDPEINKYTKTIMVYTNKLNLKVAKLTKRINLIIANSKKQMRNAPVSSKSKTKGKNLKQTLKEQENLKVLEKELSSLYKSSSKAKATSKWLYIASK